jgi:hypothetical protein
MDAVRCFLSGIDGRRVLVVVSLDTRDVMDDVDGGVF